MEVLATLVYMLLAYVVTFVIGVITATLIVTHKSSDNSESKSQTMITRSGIIIRLSSISAAVAVLVYKVWPYL